ncbi:hypothetical protein DFJ43DRAFT_856146 [Lentinula guzmanii]|uniref:Uncharacterized protein n=1 Tax=Lentinula guzmanii TaxID=2804957 RepID=A0AA38J2V8_9AGAR|nr:hypothetical protein DFJ43DRAFT_856146 [Lentinula guzmanii]
MATLAARLNELAAANEKGLLNDDEYRILRQDVFERYAELGRSERSNRGTILVEPSNTNESTTTNSVQPRLKKLTRRPSEFRINAFASTSSEKDKKSNNNAISSFIRRAKSPLRSSPSLLGPNNTSPSTSRKSSHEPTISRSSSRKNLNSVPDPHLLSPPTSPTRPVPNHPKRPQGSSSSIKSSAKVIPLPAMLNHDIFEDGGLYTSADIRHAIADLDEDAKRLIRAFDELEDSAVKRAKTIAQSAGRVTAIPPSSSSSNSLTPPTIQHRSRSDSATTASGGGMQFTATSGNAASKPVHTRARSRSTTSIQPKDVPHKSHPILTLHTTSSQTPTLQRKGSVSSLASSLFSLKSKASMPSLPSLPSIPSISTMPSIPRSRSGSVASPTPSSHNPSDSFSNTFSSVSGYSISSSGKSINRRPSMSTEASSSGHGRSSTSTGASSIHTTTSTSSTGRTSISSGHGHGHTTTALTPSTTTLSRAASTASISRSNPKSSSSTSVHFRGDSTDSGRLKPSGYSSLDEVDELDEIRQIQQRRRDVIGRYDARREYLKARLRGAELHERVVKGR